MLEVASHVEHVGAWWPIFPLFWLVFWVGVIFFVFRAKRHHWSHHHGPSGSGVLAERFAKGEISAEEYRERLEVLKEARR